MRWSPPRFLAACRRAQIRPGTLARRIGITKAAVYNWIDGSVPSIEHAAKAADVLGIDMRDLLDPPSPRRAA